MEKEWLLNSLSSEHSVTKCQNMEQIPEKNYSFSYLYHILYIVTSHYLLWSQQEVCISPYLSLCGFSRSCMYSWLFRGGWGTDSVCLRFCWLYLSYFIRNLFNLRCLKGDICPPLSSEQIAITLKSFYAYSGLANIRLTLLVPCLTEKGMYNRNQKRPPRNFWNSLS